MQKLGQLFGDAGSVAQNVLCSECYTLANEECFFLIFFKYVFLNIKSFADSS